MSDIDLDWVQVRNAKGYSWIFELDKDGVKSIRLLSERHVVIHFDNDKSKGYCGFEIEYIIKHK